MFNLALFALLGHLATASRLCDNSAEIYTKEIGIEPTSDTTSVSKTFTFTNSNKRIETSPTQATPITPSAGKRGFAYNDAILVNNLIDDGVHGSWAYNWDSSDNGLSDSIEFVPMLWSDHSDHTNRWPDNVKEMLRKGATHLLSFNEGDRADQANMSPETAAGAHLKWMNPYSNRARISAPAISNSNLNGEGIQWLEQFITICERLGCKIDFCVAHWYSQYDQGDALIQHLEEVHRVCKDRPVWLTEFAPFGNEQQINEFLKSNLGRLDNDVPWLERYAYFMVRVGSLMSSSDRLSSNGNTFFFGPDEPH